jgi:dienelactone hydrolase
MKYLLPIIFILFMATNVQAKLHTETVEYKEGDTFLEGYLAYDDAVKGKRPGIMVIHEWTGLGPYIKRRANELAELGYIAFAADIYGKGVRPKDHEEAARVSGMYFKDRSLMSARAKAGLQVLRNHKLTDKSRIAAIGYCFGGATVLELARSGTDVAGVVSFHGALATPNPEEGKNIKAKVLVLHGAEDSFVPREAVLAFQNEMRKAGADWQMVIFGGAVHSFTVPEAGNDPSKGMAYNEKADKRSWEMMKLFFKEIFR